MTNPTFGDNGMYENLMAGKLLDLDGATPVSDHDDPDPDLLEPGRDSDGVSAARTDADAAPH
jgi:hypothetical protein